MRNIRNWSILILVVAIVVGAVWMVNLNKKEEVKPGSSQNTVVIPSSDASAGSLEGELQASDNPAKGNLMLITPKRTIYVHTSRDFSTLIGKQVGLVIDGIEDNFTLKDIVAK